MLNVNALNKTLSRMELPELQAYAAAHKNDPYVVAMALSIANTKKQAKLAEAGLAGAGAAAQPTVVDQDIANLSAPASYSEVPYSRGATPTKYEQVPYAEGAAQLPEDTGIGQLPANNLQGMAEGGIVAFGDGGEVPRFNGQDSSVPKELPGGLGILGQGSFSPQVGAAENEPWLSRKMDEVAQKVLNGTASPQEQQWVKMFGGNAMTRVNERERQAAYANAPAQSGAETARLAAQNLAAAPADTTGTTGNQGAGNQGAGNQGAGNQGTGNQGTGNQKFTGAPSVGIGGIGSLSSQFQTFLKDNKPAGPEDMDAYMKRREAYLGDNPTKKQMERIDKQEAQALADKEEAKAMAIIRAGLGMMSGTSQHALTNIGQGATAGIEDYAASQKEAKKLKLERDKMRDAVENAAFAYKKGDLDSYEKYAADAKKLQADFANHGLSALGTVAAHEVSGQYGLASAREHAAATKSAGPLAVYNALGNGDLAKGFQMAKQIEAGTKKDLMSEYTAWLTANPTMGTLEPEKAAAAFLKTKGLFDLATANATNLKPTKEPTGQVRVGQ